MGSHMYYGWHIEVYDNGGFLLGGNINTNILTGYNREFYLCFYIGRWTISVGRFFKRRNK
ncbi:hypothetical protein D3C87_980320 [compost metagenome]